MAFVLKERVAETTTTTGTGTVTLGGAMLGFQSFGAIGNANTTCYLILSGNQTDWEFGIGTYTSSGTTLARTTILESSNSGSAISLVGTSLVMCSMPANISGANGLLNQLFGSPANGNYNLTVTSGVWTVTTASAGGGGSGLYSQVLSTLPTSANTGLTTWLNQGTAAVTDAATGVTIADVVSAGANLRCRYKTAPATPYTITALIGVSAGAGPSNFISGGIGWHDGTKLQTVSYVFSSGWAIDVQNFTNVTSFSANVVGTSSNSMFNPVWMRIKDDGTNIFVYISADGTFQANTSYQLYTVAKASGFLGSGGYSNVMFFNNPQGTGSATTLMSWAQA